MFSPGKKKRPKILQPAQEIIAPWLARLGITPDALAVFEAWDRLLGPESAKARAVGLKADVLYVETDHSARLHDLSLRKPALLKRLNGYLLKSHTIKDFRVTLSQNR